MSPVQEIIPADHEEATEFLVELSRALAANGSTADRIESALSTAARRIGIHAEFFATPTSVFASIGVGRHNVTKLVRVESADINLSRLTRLDAVLQAISAREITIAEARAQIAETLASPSPWPVWGFLLANAVASATASVFFGGAFAEIAIAAVAGLSVGLLGLLTDHIRRLLRVFEFLSGFLVSIIALAAARLVGPLQTEPVILGGLIALIPGLSLTVAVSEIATRHLLSGASRLIGATASLASIVFGVAAGTYAVQSIAAMPPVEPTDPLPALAEWSALAAAPFALTILFKAEARDALGIFLVCVLGFTAARFLGEALGPVLGVAAGAICVGMLANLRAIVANKPVAVCLIPGILLLVPGSVGFRSLSAFLEQQTVLGLQTAIRAAVIALALATGLLLANVLLPPKRDL